MANLTSKDDDLFESHFSYEKSEKIRYSFLFGSYTRNRTLPVFRARMRVATGFGENADDNLGGTMRTVRGPDE